MNSSLIRYIWSNSARQQIGLVILSIVGLPFYYLSLELPKRIINRALGDARPLHNFVDRALADLEAEPLLIVLSVSFLVAVALLGACKFALNVYKSRVSEQLLRTMRRELCARALRFPLDRSRHISSDEMVTMVTAELDSVGGYASDALALPALQGGLFLTGLTFIFFQDLAMGLAAIALFPVQGVVTPILQRQVNRLTRQRVLAVRRFAASFSLSFNGLEHVRGSGSGSRMLNRINTRLGEIQQVRYALVVRKSFIKVLNNFLFQLTPFLFLMFGGLMVLHGDLTLGALVAILAAYKDLPPPARELLDYFQSQQDSQLKYEQVVAQFNPPGLETEQMFQHEVGTARPGGVSLEARRLVLTHRDGHPLSQALSFQLAPAERVAVVGLDLDAGHALAHALTRLRAQEAGEILLDGRGLESVSEPELRATVQLVTTRPTFLGETLSADLWDDRRGAGEPETVMAALNALGLERDLLRIGLDAHLGEEHAAAVLKARHAVAAQTGSGESALIDPFEPGRVNRQTSIGENVVWAKLAAGAPALERLYGDPYMHRILERAALTETLRALGERLIEDALKPAGGGNGTDSPAEVGVLHDDELVVARRHLDRRVLRGKKGFDAAGRKLLVSFALRCSVAQLPADESIAARILEARSAFARDLPARLRAEVIPLEKDRYNPGLTLEENLIFGSLRVSDSATKTRLRNLLYAVIEEIGLGPVVREAALQVPLVTGASDFNAALEQRLGLARTLLGTHGLVVVDRATSELDLEHACSLIRTCLGYDPYKTWLWILGRPELAQEFDRVIDFTAGDARTPHTRFEIPR